MLKLLVTPLTLPTPLTLDSLQKIQILKFRYLITVNLFPELVSEKINELVYPAWRKVPFQAKTPSTFFSPKDDWFFKLPDTDIVKQRWKIGLEELWRNIPDDWKKNPNSMYNGMGFMSSKVYDVGT